MKVGVLAKRAGVVIVSIGAVALFVISFVGGDDDARMGNGAARLYPALFGESPTCPSRDNAIRSGVHAEETARFRSDRYPYDPRDGVWAVQGYRTAASCYEAAGRTSDAERARLVGQELADRMVTDYAAARLKLANAIEAERWADVLRETRYLQLLTSHLGGHEYVEWLKRIVGRATARHHGSS